MGIMRQAQRAVTGLHARVYRLTGGRVGWHLGRVESVLLTTTGRRSGRSRTTPLTTLVEGERLYLVASNGGAQRHPDWYLNLCADPRVVVQRGATRTEMTARTASEPEREQLWPRMVQVYRGYAGYQKRTERTIPVVVCEPRE